MSKQDVNAIIRRMDLDADGKISFREFSHGITPEYPGVSKSVTSVSVKKVSAMNGSIDFNLEKKQEIKRQHEETKQKSIRKDNSLSPLRDYRQIYNAPPTSDLSQTKRLMGSPISMVIRRDVDPNVRSPIRPYGEASFLSMRDDFFGDGTKAR